MLRVKSIYIPKNTIWLLLWILLLLHSGLINMLFPFLEQRYIEIAKFIFTLVAFGCAFSPVTRVMGKRKLRYLNLLVTVYILIIVMSCIYTVASGYETVTRVFMNSLYYFTVLLVYPILYVALRFHNGQDLDYLDGVATLIVLTQIIRAANLVLYNWNGMTFINGFIAVQTKYGNSTAVSNALDHFIPIYSFYRMLNVKRKSQKKKFAFYTIISVFFVVRGIYSRMMILSVVGSMAMLWVVNRQYKKKTIIAVATILIGAVIFVNTGYFQDFTDTLLSADANDFAHGIYGNTASARLLYIETISKMKFPTMTGIGMVSYGSSRLNYFFPEGATEDIGYLGDFYLFGVLILVPISMLLIRNLSLLKKNIGKRNSDLLAGLFTFLCITGVTLSVFGARKILLLPIVLSILEMIDYNSCKKLNSSE